MEEMIDRVAKAVDAVQIWSRFNDWTADSVDGLPIEICRWRADATTTDDFEIVKRFPAAKGEDAALREVVSEMRARAAIEAMMPPTEAMLKAAADLKSPCIKYSTLFNAMISAALSPSTRGADPTFDYSELTEAELATPTPEMDDLIQRSRIFSEKRGL